ncbi:MAG TPA: hypothetical protein VFR44_09780 [Actinomycetota bacterium]|nr:hypothetical protein [Actinomycetota bacterium]
MNMGRWSEQFLSKRIGEAKYEEVLAFLRANTQNTVEIWIETQERTSLHVMGTLMEVSHDPSSWGRATSFVVIASGQDADAWHLSDDLRERLGRRRSTRPPFLSVPRHGISRYQCIDDSGVGFGFALGAGTELVLLLWDDAVAAADSRRRSSSVWPPLPTYED